MRIRSLQTYLSSHNLINYEDINNLSNKRIGVDAIYWLRSIPNLKDPSADAIGGLSPCMYRVIDRSLEYYQSKNIEFIFVFQGIQPKSYISYYSPLHNQIEEAWKYISKGNLFMAQQHFAQATSRITSEFIFAVKHYLLSKKKHVITAPFFPISQILYLSSIGAIDAVFGPPSCILFGIPRVIININTCENRYDWIKLDTILQTWKITERQFIEACLLAGTEYSLTFPCFNLLQETGEKFYFGAAIEFIKQASLASCVEHFFNGENHADYVNGYAVCNVILKHTLALHLDGHIRSVPRSPITKGGEKEDELVPDALSLENLKQTFGTPLPDSVYILMSRQVLSRKLPAVLALGQWRDNLCPIVDSVEHCEILKELLQYRRRALGLIAMRLPEVFQTKPIKFSKYSCNLNPQVVPTLTATPDCHPGMPWYFTAEQLEEEMKRQNVTEISFHFCLNWHSYEISRGKTLLATHINPVPKEPVTDIHNLMVLRATVHFMILENLGFFTPEGRGTIFGSALASSSSYEQEVLISLELMKTGNLMGEPLEPTPERPNPSKLCWLRNPSNEPNQYSILLLSRIASLVRMSLHDTDLWLQPVDYDLAGFHTIIRVLKRTLQLLMEACLNNLLLKDISAVQNIPLDEMAPQCPKLPIFALSRNCLGIVFKHFLENDYELYPPNLTFTDSTNYMAYKRRWKKLENELNITYPCCKYPISDIFKAIRFWLKLYRVVEFLGQNVDIGCLKSDMEDAHKFLLQKIHKSGLDDHFLFDQEVFAPMQAEIAAMFNSKNNIILTPGRSNPICEQKKIAV